MKRLLTIVLTTSFLALAQLPHAVPGGFSLPNGWQITPVGKAIPTEDLILNLSPGKDGRVVVAQHGGFNPHGLAVIDTTTEEAVQRIGLQSARDTDNVAVFFKELHEYEKNYDSTDVNKRLPNLIVMSLPEDHTVGTRPGGFTPRAMVANHDYAIGQLVERLSNSPYWKEMAIFMIQDDAQDAPDHVDARPTVGLVEGPFVKRGFVDSTLYTRRRCCGPWSCCWGCPQ